MKKLIILILGFYFLILFQSSFLIHFNIFLGWLGESLILILVILINILAPHHFLGKKVQTNEWYEKWWGVNAAFFAGFFLDIFSENFFGFWILILLVLSCFIKFVLKKHVQFPILKRV